MSQKSSPFKFLDSYTKEDVKIFFGRNQETKDLYDALSGVKHLLVYGPSGSGKSSLVECGLRNQFSDADWFALTIRKGLDINASVFASINEALRDKIELDPQTRLPINPEIGFGEAIEKLFEERYQPIYLLFDQFEELLITGDRKEKIDFFTNLNTLIRNRLPSRVLLIMREEFIGHFSEFESLCPSIFQHRFRVEKMGRKQVQEVLQAMLEAPLYLDYFDVKDSKKLAEKILSKLPDQRKEIELSHVQVFLGELWDRAIDNRTGNELPTFSADLLKMNDNLESVLESFLIKQTKELEKTYGKRVPIELLAVMISERFTKLQLSKDDILEELKAKEVTSERPLSELLEELQTRRIIRAIKVGDESQYEISHDTLALVVGQNLTERMKMREKASNVYKTYEERSGLFSQADIDHLRSFKRSLKYPPELDKRINKSIATLESNRNAQLNKTRKRLLTVYSLLGIALLALFIGGYFWFSADKAKLLAEELSQKSQSQTLATLSSEQLNKNPTLAIRLAQEAWQIFPFSPPALSIQKTVLKAFYEPSEGKNFYYTNTIEGHEDVINSAVFSPNGKTFVTASDDKRAKLWNTQTGKLLATLEGHHKPVITSMFSPNGNIIVTASRDKSAKLWNAKDGKFLSTLEGHNEPIRSAVFSPNNKIIVTASSDHSAKLWNVEKGQFLRNLNGHKEPVNSAVFSPDGETIITASDDKTSKIWSVETGEQISVLKGHRLSVKTAVFSPNGETIVTASEDHTARIWNNKGKLLTTLEGHKDWVVNALFSPVSSNDSIGGKNILTVSSDKTAKLWNTETGMLLATLEGHEKPINSAVFSINGKTILTASSDKTAKLWDAESGKHLADLKGHEKSVNTAVFSNSGETILTASSDQTTKLWNVKTEKYLANLNGHKKLVNSAVFSPNGRTLVTASSDKTAKLWDVKNGKLLLTLVGHEKLLKSAVFSPDGETIVTASDDKTAKIWNAKTGNHLADLKGHTQSINSAEFSPNGELIVTASWDHTAKLWDAATGKHLADLKGHKKPVNTAVFSPDGKTILTTSNGDIAKLWNVENGEHLADLKGHEEPVNSGVFSPDGKTIVTASDDKTAKIWDVQSRKLLATLEGHERPVFSAVFSPACPDDELGGKTILTASDDNTAKLWDASTGDYLATLDGHERPVYSALFSPDGKTIVTASWDHTAKLWNAVNGEYIATLEGHKKNVYCAVFSPHGEYIVTASWSETPKVWFAAEGIIDLLDTTPNIYKLTKQDLDNVGVDFINLEN